MGPDYCNVIVSLGSPNKNTRQNRGLPFRQLCVKLCEVNCKDNLERHSLKVLPLVVGDFIKNVSCKIDLDGIEVGEVAAEDYSEVCQGWTSPGLLKFLLLPDSESEWGMPAGLRSD